MLKPTPVLFPRASESCVGKRTPYKLQGGGQRTQLPFHLFPDPDTGSTPNASGIQKQKAVSPMEG